MQDALDAARVAFGVASPRESHRTVAFAIALAASLALVALGYTGSHDPRYWSLIAGIGIFPVLFFWLGALVALALARDGLVIGAASAAAIMGSFGTYTGWSVVLRALDRYPLERHFEVFNDGMSEANANRFVGFGLCARVCSRRCPLDTRRFHHGTHGSSRWRAPRSPCSPCCSVHRARRSSQVRPHSLR